MYLSLSRLSVLALVLSLGVLLPSCATNPVTGKKQISFISEESEIQMGQSYDPQVVAEFGIYEDPQLQSFLSEKGKEMAAISERPNLPWTFRLVDSDVVNAFAVPGGFVYFTRGIMAHFNNEAQFAGVLGHEIGHVTARHTVAQQSKQQLLGGAAMVGMILSPELASQGESLMQGMQLLFLKYGRDAESQSDELGVKYSTAIGYDSKEMAGFFKTLDRLSGGAENRAPSFLSTHPDPLNREARVQELTIAAQAADTKTDYEVDRDGYLRRIDGLLYGEDPDQGYVESGAFYHPALRFRFGIPKDWQLINAPTMVQMVSPNQDAMMQMRLAQGTDTRAAAEEFVTQSKLQVSSSSDQAINGLPATTLVGEITQQDQQSGQTQKLGVITSFIAYGGNIYMLTGLSVAQNFRKYAPLMENTIRSFSELTDQSKLNRQPERIKIVTVPVATTLQQALLNAGIPQTRLQEFSVLNGMELNTQLPAGYLIKTVSGGTSGVKP
ncbi:Beta-barrel assembly-enhancing protease [Neolewinella maritima]|uniref:Beta-barrel assembly-enhancing protease n=1 Tax=Neolewinella maritima TaxID=1383882 RepID=A0ABM9AXD8_9BACT|nr:M48 family metalloprotease [Neolewinella maritima]CAH0998877.1 Beta-barrel assembly-enhancing protease [Neolewinella maritima]